MVRLRNDHSWKRFLKRTVAAQIHLAGFIASMIGLVVLCLSPEIRGLDFLACAIFVLSGAFVMAVSAFYHFVHDGMTISRELEHRLELLDHISIYLFIAGTYTPFLLKTINSDWQKPLMILIWSIAISGVAYTLFKHRLPAWMRSRFAYTSGFLVMGWTSLIRAGEIFRNLSAAELTHFLVGAGAYTTGAFIYALKRPNPFPGIFGFHEIWHLAVVAGFIAHFALILEFFRPIIG